MFDAIVEQYIATLPTRKAKFMIVKKTNKHCRQKSIIYRRDAHHCGYGEGAAVVIMFGQSDPSTTSKALIIDVKMSALTTKTPQY